MAKTLVSMYLKVNLRETFNFLMSFQSSRDAEAVGAIHNSLSRVKNTHLSDEKVYSQRLFNTTTLHNLLVCILQ